MAAVTGVYNVIRPQTTTSTAITIQQVTVVAGTMIEISRWWANQGTITTSSQTMLRLLLKSSAATVTSQTPAALTQAAQASKCVGGTTATGITATIEGTDSTVVDEQGFNEVNGILVLPVPEERSAWINRSIGMKFPTGPTSAGFTSGMQWLEYAA